MSYLGRSAKLSLKAQEKVSFLATAGQTVKTGLSYTPSFIEVYVNGVLLTDTTDFTATNGNSITFTVALLLNDEVTVISLKTFTVADHYNKTEADTLLAAKATIANFTSTGIDDNATSTAVTIDASENVLVGKTTGGTGTQGVELNPTSAAGYALAATSSGQRTALFNRLSSDGEIISLRKDGTSVGSIGTSGNQSYIHGAGTDVGLFWGSNNVYPYRSTGLNDATIDLGQSSKRFKDLYLSGNANCERVNTTHDGDWGMEMKGVTSARIRFHTSAGGSGQVGSITVSTSSTNYAVNSDYRLKEDDVPMTGATERVKALRPINFAWKVDGSRVDGFFAHELAEVVPEAVTGTKDAMMDEEYEVTPATDTEAAVMGTRSVPDMQGIDQAKLVPLLTATIQELIARIEALEGE